MKQIVKNFNKLIKKTIFKVENKTNNNLTISNFNKYLITIVSLLFIYLFYLLIPTFYDKTWLQTNIESKLLNEFKINLSTSGDIAYRILPKPHFLIKDSEILIESSEKKQSVAEIKNFKIFLDQSNFFNKEKIKIHELKLNNVNFSLLKDNLRLLNNISNNKLSNKKIKINNSNIFFKDDSGQSIAIIKIFKSFLFFDEKKLLNIFNFNGEVFNVPFKINLENQIDSINNKRLNIYLKNLRMNFFNESSKDSQGYIGGKNIISFLDSTMSTKYDVKNEVVTFSSKNSKIHNSKVNYNGVLSVHPFDLNVNFNLGNYRISKFFNINTILSEFCKSGLLFNDNISLSASIVANSKIKEEIFQKAQINFRIVNGKIDFNNTKFINDKIGSVELENSNLFFKDKNLILNTDILIDIKNSHHLFSSLNTNKSSRKDFKKILINLDFDFITGQFTVNDAKIDNIEFSDQLLKIIRGFEDNNLNNTIRSRRLINELFKAYAG